VQYPPIEFKSRIEICHLNYQYPGSEKPVLKDINLTVHKGEVIGFVGSSGAGKTTLADVLLGLFNPDSGEIIIDNSIKLNSKQLKYLNIGYIPQNIYLSDDSIKNNIAFGVDEKDIDIQRVESAAQMAQLNELIEHLPGKMDTVIGENGIRLSGGQRQRIGIARALYNNPDILIMDEATSALDNTTEKLFVQSIEKLRGKITMIIIAHRLTTVKRCDKLYLLKNGVITATGTYDELLQINPDFLEMATA